MAWPHHIRLKVLASIAIAAVFAVTSISTITATALVSQGKRRTPQQQKPLDQQLAEVQKRLRVDPENPDLLLQAARLSFEHATSQTTEQPEFKRLPYTGALNYVNKALAMRSNDVEALLLKNQILSAWLAVEREPEFVAIIQQQAAAHTELLKRLVTGEREKAAIFSLRALNTAQALYASTCANGFYAPTLQSLKTASTGGSPFLDWELQPDGSRLNLEYRTAMGGIVAADAPATCTGDPAGAALKAYWATAAPIEGADGRYFATNSAGVIYESPEPIKMDPAHAPPRPAVPIQ